MIQENNNLKAAAAANRERLIKMLETDEGRAFRQGNPNFTAESSTSGRVQFLNPANSRVLDQKKLALGFTNNDIIDLMDNLCGQRNCMSIPTFIRKMRGKADFTASEILLLAEIFDLSGPEILEIFHLLPDRRRKLENPQLNND